jgi:hypothetical protein
MRERNGWEMNVPDSQFRNKFDGRKRRDITAPLSNHKRSESHLWSVMISFQVIGLPFERFRSLFHLSDTALAERNVRRVIATSKPGYPCRVSLADAEIGEELLLLSFEHQPAVSPYRSSGPIFVRKAAVETNVEPGVVPDNVRIRLMSVRAAIRRQQFKECSVPRKSRTSTCITRVSSTLRLIML